MNPELLTNIRSHARDLVSAHKGIKGQDLVMKLIADYAEATNDYFERAISELVQENEIVRIEYQIPDSYSNYHTFYLPQGSRIV